MTTRSRKEQYEVWCERIKASNLINRLVQHCDGEIKLDASQIRAIEILLKRVWPELKAMEITGNIDHNISHIDELEKLRIKAEEARHAKLQERLDKSND